MQCILIQFVKNKLHKGKQKKVTIGQDKRIRKYYLGMNYNGDGDKRQKKSESELDVTRLGRWKGVLARWEGNNKRLYLPELLRRRWILEYKVGEGLFA